MTREPWRVAAARQTTALAQLSVPEHEARLVLDWDNLLVHKHLYRGQSQPATVRAGLSPELKFHSLRHTYASLCIAAGIEPLKLSRRLGHNKVSTTLNIYTHLFPTEDHSNNMAQLDTLAAQASAAFRAAAECCGQRRQRRSKRVSLPPGGRQRPVCGSSAGANPLRRTGNTALPA